MFNENLGDNENEFRRNIRNLISLDKLSDITS